MTIESTETSPIGTVAVIGTGTIGAPVAKNLDKHGFAVRVWNRTAEKASKLSDGSEIKAFSTVAEAVQGANIIVTVLKDGPAVLAALTSAEAALQPGTLWIQLSTVGLDAIEDLANFAKSKGLIFFDAPVQGTKQPAENGQLVIIASGPTSNRSQAEQVFNAIGKRTVWVAEEPGASSKLKLALNSWVFALTHGVAESLALAKGLGVDPALVVDVVSGGPMDNAYFQLKSAAILAEDYAPSFTVDNAAKDAKLVVEAAQKSGVRVDAAAAGLARFERASQAGHGGKDMAASYLAS